MTLCVNMERGGHRMATESEAKEFLPVMTSCEWPFDKEYDEKLEKIENLKPKT